MRLDHLLSMETGTDFHGSVIRVNDESRSTEFVRSFLLFNFQGSEMIFEKRAREYGGVAQLGEHLPCKQGVMGSNPIISTIPGNREHGKRGRISQKRTVCSSGG